ncbi:MAG: 1-acyl-sn-glycerol-3-phosphate acyltransferase [Dysgonamonadaceae bacterium]|jgi:1-acyl-sn-glycerol-3-phosphate acyltransferase|nr:1-acyl-sn-glycerol-3-phosphate acyltransferase [Dysgonamonadaceae bacterium]
MEKNHEFDDIRPLYDEEIPAVIDELLEDPEFKRVVYFILPYTDWEAFKATMRSFKTKGAFQRDIVSRTVKDLMAKTTTSVTLGGLENLEKGKSYTFVSNHRDIVLDSGILCILLLDAGLDTVEIAIGNNLLINPWIEKFVRLNKSFIVRRGVSVRQMLEVSTKLSRYIHHTIKDKNQSVWIAQREGRSKDSSDSTQESLLKMLSLAENNFITGIKDVNILPLSISYEYDPCDYLKSREFQLKRDVPEYKKSPLDDLINMETGLFGHKGRVHFQIGHPINPEIDKLDAHLDKPEQIKAVATIIDSEIHLNYSFYPGNYIAYDRMTQNTRFESKYTSEDVDRFDKYLKTKLNAIKLEEKDTPFLTEKILEMYANPLKNHLLVVGEH